MIPTVYELEGIVIVPVKRNILKQTFYVREYFSMNNDKDTVTFFVEHMADRFVPTSKDAKIGVNSSLRILASHHYSRYKAFGKDSIAANSKSEFPSLLKIFNPNDGEITADGTANVSGKSGMALIQKQNARTFTTIEDMLAYSKDHKMSPLPLKLLGFAMELNQLYTTHSYMANDTGIYLPKDLIEANFVMEADGKGPQIRKALKSDTPVIIRSMIEMYIVDREYLSKEEANEESKNKPADVKFVIPSTVPPLNEATARLVERANAGS